MEIFYHLESWNDRFLSCHLHANYTDTNKKTSILKSEELIVCAFYSGMTLFWKEKYSDKQLPLWQWLLEKLLILRLMHLHQLY